MLKKLTNPSFIYIMLKVFIEKDAGGGKNEENVSTK